MSGASTINHLLAYHLAAAEEIPQQLEFVLSILNQRPIQQLEIEGGIGNTVSKRWTSRILSLLKPINSAEVRQAGFVLLHQTLSASPSTLLLTAKEVLSYALNILESPKDNALFFSALEVVRLILGESIWVGGEWSRDTVGAATVQRTVKALVKVANGTLDEIKISALAAIVTIIPLYPTPLRPIYASLHDLSLALLCTERSKFVDAGASLIVNLYLIAKNGKDGLREAWRLTLEGLVASIDGLIPHVTSDIFAEDPLTNHTLSAFKLPQLSAPSTLNSLLRIEAISVAISLALRTPTSERTGPVEVPVGAIAELGIRLLSLNSDMPVKERVEPKLLEETKQFLPRLQIIGCQILAQLSLAVGSKLVANASEILGMISRTLITYPLRSPMRAPLSTTYSIVLHALGASIDPEEGKKSLARVWRCVLEDIGGIASEPKISKVEDRNLNTRKIKRQKTFDPTESMELAGRKVRVDEIDLKIAQSSLDTLERLLLSPHSHFLPPKLQLATSQLLLTLTLSPSFFTSQPSTSTNSNPTYSGKTTANRGIEIAFQSILFRRGVLQCLAVLCSEGGSSGLADRAVEVWKRGAADRDTEIKRVSFKALSAFSHLIHPTLPPLQMNSTFAKQLLERQGGSIGDSVDIEDGADEFLSAEKVLLDADQMEVEEEIEEEEEPIHLVPTKAFGFSTSNFGSSTFGVSKPVVSVTPVAAVAVVEVEMEVEKVAKADFIIAPVRSTPAVVEKVKVPAAVVEEESDDEMPQFDFGSDDE